MAKKAGTEISGLNLVGANIKKSQCNGPYQKTV